MRRSQLPNLLPMPDVGGPKNSQTLKKKRITSATWPFNSVDYPTPLHKQACNKYCNRIEETKKAHWKNWLEEASPKDIYITNKYMTSPPSDYSNVRILTLKFTHDGTNLSANINANKVEALASTFFPPPPVHTNCPSHHLP